MTDAVDAGRGVETPSGLIAPTVAARRAGRVVVVSDHALARVGLERLLERDVGLVLMQSFATIQEFVSWARSVRRDRRPHLLVVDLDGAGVEARLQDALLALSAAGLRILGLSSLGSPQVVRRQLRRAVHGVVSTRDPALDVLRAARTVLRGGAWRTPELDREQQGGGVERPRLSGQEQRVLERYASGDTLDQVAAAIGVKRDTAKQYLDRVRDKYAAIGRRPRTKLDLARIAWADGYLEPGDSTTVLS